MIGFSYEYLSNDALCTVFINNNRAGSAFLFLHNERMYALTAYHCVFDDNTDLFHDDYAFGYENEKPFDVEVIYPQLDAFAIMHMDNQLYYNRCYYLSLYENEGR